jgi:hypothetical protein
LGNPSRVAARLDDDEKGVVLTDTLGGAQEILIVNEPGLYNVIFQSRKPEAKAFRRWVTHEVLPSIRKYGYYKAPKPVKERRPTRGRPPLALAEYFEHQQKYKFATGERCDITDLRWISRELGMPYEQISDKRTSRMVEFVNEQMAVRGIESITDIPRSSYCADDEPDETYAIVVDGVVMELVR